LLICCFNWGFAKPRRGRRKGGEPESRETGDVVLQFSAFTAASAPFLLNRTVEHKKIPARFPGRGVLGGPAYSPLVLRALDQISV
jgi:hypothetical protein